MKTKGFLSVRFTDQFCRITAVSTHSYEPGNRFLMTALKVCLLIVPAVLIQISPASGSGDVRMQDPGIAIRTGALPVAPYKTGVPSEFAAASLSDERSRDAAQEIPSPGSYARDFFPDLLYGTKRIFARDNIALAAIGFGTAALALTVDRNVSDYFKRSSPLSQGWMDAANVIGYGYVEIGVGAALFGTGELMHDKRMADAGAASLEAFLINLAFTESLKYITQRSRPNRGSKMSFPSGHASVTAAFAASISETYDWSPWLAVPLYLTTAYVGVSRIQAQEHYLSDVIAGITLGTLIGSSVAKYHKEKSVQAAPSSNIFLLPLYEDDLRGCVVRLEY